MPEHVPVQGVLFSEEEVDVAISSLLYARNHNDTFSVKELDYISELIAKLSDLFPTKVGV